MKGILQTQTITCLNQPSSLILFLSIFGFARTAQEIANGTRWDERVEINRGLLFNQIRQEDAQLIAWFLLWEKTHPELFSLCSKSQRKITFIKIGYISNALPNSSSGKKKNSLLPLTQKGLRKWDWIPSSPLIDSLSFLKKTLLKGESMHLKRKTQGGDPVPLLWRAERWRMKKPLVSVLLPQWPFMRGIRHARSWRSIHWCPTTIWKKDDKNQFVVRLNRQRLPRLAFQIVSLRKEDEEKKEIWVKGWFFFLSLFFPPQCKM